ncbi:hypothetical protein RB653_007490 [Dictyostelium firmibasis]|uniref:Fucosyltransferase n=1 Tax=Dictyostelium firmibasis TaxID=79012 RepID=A0AAN7YM29_9MYCE
MMKFISNITSSSRKQKFFFIFFLVGVSVVLMFYDEFSLITGFNYNGNNNSNNKHITENDHIFYTNRILEETRNSDVLIFLWDPSSEHNDWTGILKSKYLVTQQQINDYNNKKQQPSSTTQQQQQPTPQQQTEAAAAAASSTQLPINFNQKSSNLKEIFNERNKCSHSCRFTNIQEEIVESNLILFDPVYLHKDNWKRSPLKLPEKHSHQKFGLLHHNSKSQYSILSNKPYNELMDIDISYINSDNNLDITLACPPNISFSIDDTTNLLLKKHNDFEKRKNSTIFISSNCIDGLSLSRTNLVNELSKIIKIESLGNCLNNNKNKGEYKNLKSKEDLGTINSRIEYNMEIYKGFKFVICFENENSTNYVTEKVYTALYAGAIPIWMGAKNIDQYVPTGSIINGNEFNSILEIGEHVKSILDGKIDYQRYFNWKDSKSLEDKVIDKLKRCINSVDMKCRICESVYKSITNNDREYISTTIPKYSMTLASRRGYYTPQFLSMKGLGDHIVVHRNDDSCNNCFDLDNHYTLMAWVKPSTFSDQRIIDKNTPGTVSGYNFDIQKTSNGRGLIRLCAGAACFESFKSIPNDLWSHVAVVFSCNNLDVQKNRVTFYINGEKNAEYDNFSPTKINTFPLIIGKSGKKTESSSYNGLLDDVMIFNISLTHEDIKYVLSSKPNLSTFKFTRDLQLFYDFDYNPNNHFDSKSSDRNIVRDLSIYKNDGTFSKGSSDDYSEKITSLSKDITFNKKL